jgi:hypothetical protein
LQNVRFEHRGADCLVRTNTIDKPKFFAKALYKARARIEQMIGKIKRFKRIALRCEKTATNYASFLALVCGFILTTRPNQIGKPPFGTICLRHSPQRRNQLG